VTVKRMFSGAGIFADGLMFGLIVDGAIHLKVDETNIADFEREGSRPFTIRAAKAQADRRATRCPIGAYRSDSTTIPMNSRFGRGARLP
jgi:TfoX/Sxy family transcriptional regulator of competence genes